MQPSRSRTTATVPVSHVQAREKEDTKSCRKAVSISAKCSPAADLILPFRCFQRPEREEIGVYSCYRAVFIRPTERKVPEAGKCKAGTTIFLSGWTCHQNKDHEGQPRCLRTQEAVAKTHSRWKKKKKSHGSICQYLHVASQELRKQPAEGWVDRPSA